MGFWNQVRAVLSVPAIICIFLNVFGSCCPLIVSLRTCRSCSTRDGAKFLCGVGRNYFCHRRWEWEMAASPAGAGKGCCLVQTSTFGAVAAHLALQPSDIKQRMGMNTLIWVVWFFFAAPRQQSATLDYCCLCLCLKPALVLPHWDTTETECNGRCLARGLPGNPGVQQRCSCESCIIN